MNSASDILRRNGKSFHFASLVLDTRQAERCASLYSFCRYVDDLADEADDEEDASRRLHGLIDDLHARQSEDPVVADFLDLATECHMSTEPAIDLTHGVLQDLEREVLIHDVAELHHYCYRVAGTVGLLMCLSLIHI